MSRNKSLSSASSVGSAASSPSVSAASASPSTATASSSAAAAAHLATLPLATDPALTHGALPNGLKYYFHKHESAEPTILVHLQVAVGSYVETEDQRGIAHFLEHAVYLGTERFPSLSAIRKELQSFGVSLDVHANAETCFNTTAYYLSIKATNKDPAARHQKVHRAMQFLEQLVFHATFPPTAIQQEKKAVLAEAAHAEVEFIEMALLRHIYGDTAIPDRLAIGVNQVIADLTPDTVAQFYQQWYTARNMALFVVGAIDPDLCCASLRELFDSHPAGGLKPKPIPHNFAAPVIPPMRIVADPSVDHFHAQFTLRKPLKSRRIMSALQLQRAVLDHIVQLVFQARIDSAFRGVSTVDVQLDESVYLQEDCVLRTLVIANTPTQPWQQVYQSVMQVIHSFFQGCPITEAEISDAASIILQSARTRSSAPADIPNEFILHNILEATHSKSAVLAPHAECSAYQQILDAVRPQQIERRAKRFLHFISALVEAAPLPSSTLTVVFPGSVPVPTEQELLHHLRLGLTGGFKHQEVAVMPVILLAPSTATSATLQCPTFAPRFAAEASGVQVEGHRLVDTCTGAIFTQLSNGLAIAAKQSTSNPGRMHIRFIAPGGQCTARQFGCGAAGIGLRTWVLSGSTCHPPHILEQWKQVWSIEVSAECLDEWCSVSVECASDADHLRAAMQLIACILVFPAWDTKIFDTIMSSELEAQSGILSDPVSISANVLLRTAFDRDPRFMACDTATLQGLSQAAVQQCVLAQFVPKNLQLIAVGDFDIVEFENLCCQYLGWQPKVHHSVATEAVPLQPLPFVSALPTLACSSRELHIMACEARLSKDPTSDEAAFWMLMPFPSKRPVAHASSPDATDSIVLHPMFTYRTAFLWSRLLNERLHAAMRSDHVLCYDASVMPNALEWFERGYLLVHVLTTGSELQEAIAQACVSVKSLFYEPCTADEFEAVRSTVLSDLSAFLCSNEYWAAQLANIHLPHTAGGIHRIRDIATYFESLTPDHMNRAQSLFVASMQPQVLVCAAASSPTLKQWVDTWRPAAAVAPHVQHSAKPAASSRMLKVLGAVALAGVLVIALGAGVRHLKRK